VVFYGAPSLFSRDVIIQQVPVGTGMGEIAGMPAEGWSAAAAPRTNIVLAGGLAVILLIAALIFASLPEPTPGARLPSVRSSRSTPRRSVLSTLTLTSPPTLFLPVVHPPLQVKKAVIPWWGHPFSQNARVSRHDFTLEVIVLWREQTSARVGCPRTAAGT